LVLAVVVLEVAVKVPGTVVLEVWEEMEEVRSSSTRPEHFRFLAPSPRLVHLEELAEQEELEGDPQNVVRMVVTIVAKSPTHPVQVVAQVLGAVLAEAYSSLPTDLPLSLAH
jgi:hypothetical protein